MIHKISMGYDSAVGQEVFLERAKYLNFVVNFILIVWVIRRGRNLIFHQFSLG